VQKRRIDEDGSERKPHEQICQYPPAAKSIGKTTQRRDGGVRKSAIIAHDWSSPQTSMAASLQSTCNESKSTTGSCMPKSLGTDADACVAA
jgi:hypothetical protein